ncbi:MAG TPA: cell division protein FtsW [Candidatus Cloacimonetes bacterium]|nr:cell division protein FtsW [Candidatus Cloacimonadota bacterium]
MKTKEYIVQQDYLILLAYFLLMMTGLFMQLNISSVRTSMSFFYKQAIWFSVSLLSVWFAYKVLSLEFLRKSIPYFMVVIIILLILVLKYGVVINGAKRFIVITIPLINLSINIQPSLYARIFLVIYTAHIIDKQQKLITYSDPKGFWKFFKPLIIVPLTIYFLILFERHFSPLIISGLTLLSLFFLAKIKMNTIFAIIAILLIGGILVIGLGPKFRGERIEIYKKYSLFCKALGLKSDYKGDNEYQVKESLISLGGGKIFGTTPGRGTGKHYFLPEAKTDYIYSIVGEEFGFLGSLFVMFLYIFLFARSLINSQKQESLFLKLLGFGLGMNIFYNAMVNIGVAMSALPSTGVTLPFISYGGTSLLVNSFAIGLLLNISAKRRMI